MTQSLDPILIVGDPRVEGQPSKAANGASLPIPTGATYSRFVFPFAFHPVVDDAPTGPFAASRHYRDITEEIGDPARRSYFSREVGWALFRRARWFELSEAGGSGTLGEEGVDRRSRQAFAPIDDRVRCRLSDDSAHRELLLTVHRPRVVCFEAMNREAEPVSEGCRGDPRFAMGLEDGRLDGDSSLNRSPMRCGFLILDVSFAPYDPKASPDSRTHNCVRPAFSELLYLNEMFRYWRPTYRGHDKRMIGAFGQWSLCRPRRAPERAGVKDEVGPILKTSPSGGEARPPSPMEIYFERWARLLDYPFELSPSSQDTPRRYLFFDRDCADQARKVAATLISDDTTRSRSASSRSGTSVESGLRHSGWLLASDPRVFVWSCAVTKEVTAIRNAAPRFEPGWESSPHEGLSQHGDALERTPHWVQFLNVDRPSFGSPPSSFEADWAWSRTYRRWSHGDTLFGYTMHSGVMTTVPRENPPTWRHFADMYFNQVLLLLYVRAATFRFSRRLSWISSEDLNRCRSDHSRSTKAFSDMRWEFAHFTNIYQFPLLSDQQQSIEMYEIMRKQLDIDELFDEIQKEIYGFEEYLGRRDDSRLADAAKRLATIAALIGIVAVAVTIIDVTYNHFIKTNQDKSIQGSACWTVLIIVVLCLCSWGFANDYIQGKSGRDRRRRAK